MSDVVWYKLWQQFIRDEISAHDLKELTRDRQLSLNVEEDALSCRSEK
ncbi:MAG: hypothetical protein ISR96_02000 [Nitrospira sp.]|nr:hypothetical protein [bacterium]MBL7048290.1 hypothetical protein [Nitrospira sp.]